MKYILPFISANTYEKNKTCTLCTDIDAKFTHLINCDNIEEHQSSIEELEKVLVDGYGIIQVVEKTDSRFNKTNEFALLKNIEPGVVGRFNEYINGIESSEKDDKPCTLYSRWCKRCGARKYDIYDTLRKERMDLLPITNFFIKLLNLDNEALETNMLIVWRDTRSDQFFKSSLVINDKVIVNSYLRNQYELEPYTYPIKTNLLNTVYVINYDKYGKELVRTPLKYIIAESFNKPIPDAITDFKAYEETRLIREDLHYKREKIINLVYEPTSEITILRAALNGVPDTENYGYNIENPMVVPVKSKNTWYIKPFPQSIQRARRKDKHYQLYYDYNYNSQFAVVHLTDLVDECMNIKVQPSDRQIKVNWYDPSINWSKTLILIRETDKIDINTFNECKDVDILKYNNYFSQDFLHNYPKVFEEYMMSIHEGTIIYINTERNKHSQDSYIICEENGYKVENGKFYQVAVVPVNKNDIATIPIRQFNVLPLYLRETQNVKEDIDYSGEFQYEQGWITKKNALMWFEAKHSLVEGGILKFRINSNYPIILRVWVNQLNIFNNECKINKIYRNDLFSFELPRMKYCKVIMQVESIYTNMKVRIDDIQLIYKPFFSYKEESSLI